jgi:hypothetical protein
MLRLSRSLIVAVVCVAALLATVPVQAATPQMDPSVWESMITWWEGLVASLGGWAPGGRGGEVAVAVGNEGASISPNGFAPTESSEGLNHQVVSQYETLGPDETQTESGPSISPDG